MTMSEKKKVFETEILIQVSDINQYGHLGNDRFLTLAQEARARWVRSYGWSEGNIAGSGAGCIVTEAHIQFLSEGFLGQTLKASLYIEGLTKCSMIILCELIEKDSNTKVGLIETKLAFFDYSKRKIMRCPDALKALVEV